MRGKKAKTLRAMARLTQPDTTLEYDGGTPPQYMPIRDDLGAVVSIQKVALGVPAVIKSTCQRAIYQGFKQVFA